MPKEKQNTRCYEVTMTVYADEDATLADVRDMVTDVTWCGGHHQPDDPRFYCLDVKNLKVKRAAGRDRK